MRKWLPLLTICTGTLMLLVDVTIVNVALPDMASGLDTTFSALQWVVDIYALVLAALLMSVGTLADRLGHRGTYVAGLALFATSSAVCGLATSSGLLIAGRGVQGLGAAAMFATTFALLNSSYQGKDRGTAYGMWGAVSGAAAAIGPIAGGLLTEHLSWRWIFFVNLPFALAAIALCFRVLPADTDRRRTPTDVLGMLTFTTFAGTLTYALIKANEDGWGAGVVLALLAVSVLALLAFVAIQARIPHPMLDLSLLRNGPFVGALVAGFVLTAGAFAYLTYASIWMQSVLHMSPVEAGLASLPLAVTSFVTSASIGRMLHGSRTWIAISAGIVLTGVGGLVVAAQLGEGADWKALMAGMAISGVGVGLAAPTISSTAMASVPIQRGGMAAGAVNTARQLGFALGIAALGSVYAARISSTITDRGVPRADEVSDAVAGGQAAQVIAHAPAGVRASLESAVQAASVDGLRATALIAGFLGVAGGLVAAVLVRPRPEPEPQAPRSTDDVEASLA
ncbi:MFS transporter [Luteipulveratus halotolerans]|uniref:Multidrug MFS transporter n=1 Tax=Luteipulveratus halotolerans TaxID=1631356 RepID=A0A0L6CFW9_9MICO|nr:MFS transporter [Luteipulveratus halotolerans]KNX36470.1 multidrug MFS transporter [Luteipulveratus halotolerans]